MAIFNSYVSLPEGIYYTQYIPICTQYINGCIPEMTWNDQALINMVHPPPLAGASHVPPVEDTMPWKPGHRCVRIPHTSSRGLFPWCFFHKMKFQVYTTECECGVVGKAFEAWVLIKMVLLFPGKICCEGALSFELHFGARVKMNSCTCTYILLTYMYRQLCIKSIHFRQPLSEMSVGWS